MSSIRFNKVTKEIELIGSESFIAENFHLIHDMRLESPILKKKTVKRTKTSKISRPLTNPIESMTSETVVGYETLKSPVKSSAIEPKISEDRQEPKITRPPLRKYFDQNRKLIRSEYKSVVDNQSVIGKAVPAPISNRFFISSLKESLGLPENQIEGIFRDAEREGRVRINSDGSYEWL